MKKIYSLIIASTILSANLFGQGNRIWGTYYGGSGDEQLGADLALDATGNVYFFGSVTTSTSAIASGGFQNVYGGSNDAFLIKFDANGNRIWGTYYGGSSSEIGRSVATDPSGNIYIAGSTMSSSNIASGGFQNTFGGFGDAFLVKFDAAGNRLWATYYGNTGQDDARGVATDAAGNVYICGFTNSTTGMTTAGSHQSAYGGGGSEAYLVKFDSNGNRLWATYYGGSGSEDGFKVNVDAAGNVYMVGLTTTPTSAAIASGGFQNTSGGGQDIYVVKFNSSGVRQWGTYYGDTGGENPGQIKIDGLGFVYVSGGTNSTANIASGGFQNTFSGFSDAFLVKFNSSGNRIWSTYYGGPSQDDILGLAVDNYNDVYLGGMTVSTTSISSSGFQNSFGGGSDDAFLVHFDSNGNRISATYYGGSLNEQGTGVAARNGYVYQSGFTQSTSNIASGGFQNTYGGGPDDLFLVKFSTCVSSPSQPGSISGSASLCNGAPSQSYSIATVVGATSYTWSLPGGWAGSSTTNTISATPGATGVFTVTASNACGTSPQQTLAVTVNPQPTISVNSGSICSGQTFTMVPSGASTYTFQGGSATVNPSSTTSYTVVGTSTAGCVSASPATSNVTVVTTPTVSAGSSPTITCTNSTVSLNGSGATTYTWSGTGIVSGGNTSSPVVNMGGTYSVTGSNSTCNSNMATVTVMTNTLAPTVTANTSNSVICGPPFQGTATLTASGASTYTWNPGGAGTSIAVSPSVTSQYTVTGTNSVNGCTSSAVFTQSVSTCAGITPLSLGEGSGVRLYPNPTSGEVYITGVKEGALVEIYNVLGEKVISTPFSELVLSGVGGEKGLGLTPQPAGIYFVKIGTVTKKIIKE